MNVKSLKPRDNSYMAKRSKRHPSRRGRDQAGCMWSLISLFDFRQSRSPKRLLSDRSRSSKPLDDSGDLNAETILLGPDEKCKSVVDADEGKIPNVDVGRTSVKELMEEEMINELDSKNKSNNSETSSDQVESKYRQCMKKNHKRKSRICDKSSDMDVSELEVSKCSRPVEFSDIPDLKISDNIDIETIMEELAKIDWKSTNGENRDFHDDLGMQTGQVVTVVEESIIAAIKLFLDQRVSSGDEIGQEGKSCCSEFADALKTLGLNKGLFFKLLKDPNSALVKCIQNFDDAHVEKDRKAGLCSESNSSEEKPVNLQSDGLSSRKHRNFFFRRKSNPSKGDIDDQSSSKIVILKPGSTVVSSPETGIDVRRMSLQSYYMDNKAQNERNVSQFSFHEIKRKLRHAMGKERQGISPDKLIARLSSKHRNVNNRDRGVTGENFPWSSPNRNHFYTERFAKSVTSSRKGGEIGNLKAHGSGMMKEASQCPRPVVSNIYTEAKRHLSEILNNGDENAPAESQQFHKSLGRILALPDYNSSPCYSPKSYHADAIIPAYMKFSPSDMFINNMNEILLEDNSNQPSLSRKTSENEIDDSGDNLSSSRTNANVLSECSLDVPSIAGEITHCGAVLSLPSRVVESEEKIELNTEGEENASDISSESSCNLVSVDYQNGDVRAQDNDENASCWRIEMDLTGDDQLFSPVTPPSDKMERPSPVSVLEPFVIDDDISPAVTKSQPVEKDIQPLQIHFEEQSSTSDQGICVRISLEDEESAFEYVEAVLLASDLNWNEFLRRWLSSQPILESSLFDDVQLFSSRPRQDQKLLFDCANDALKEICEHYFGCFSGMSCAKQIIQPVPKAMDLIHQVWELVERYVCEYQSPCSFEQLMEKDMSNSEERVNLQTDMEKIRFETWETIFDELMEDVVLSFVDEIAPEHTCKV